MIQHLTTKPCFSSMGPICTPKVGQKGSMLRPLPPQNDPKEPHWRPKGPRRSHCDGLGRLKMVPKGAQAAASRDRLDSQYHRKKTQLSDLHLIQVSEDFQGDCGDHVCLCVGSVWVCFLVEILKMFLSYEVKHIFH